MKNSALISQNARKIKDKDNLRGVPNIKKLSYVKSLKIEVGRKGYDGYDFAKTLIIYAEMLIRYRVI